MNICFLGGPLRWLTDLSSNNKKDLWWAVVVLLIIVRIVQNFFTAGFDSGQLTCCQNIFQLDLRKRHVSSFITFRKLVCNVFWTGCEYKHYAQFHCLDLDLWLANFKICPIFCLGGLGSCGRTVKTFAVLVAFQNRTSPLPWRKQVPSHWSQFSLLKAFLFPRKENWVFFLCASSKRTL